MSWFIHPRYLSAYAAAADRDPDLQKGTHLRLFPSDVIGFPLAPWRLWDLPALRTEAVPIQWFDLEGRPLPAPDLDAAGGEAIGWITGTLPNQARLIGVEVEFTGGGPGEIAVLDRIEHRVIASRETGRLLVAAPEVSRVRLRGRGPFALVGWIVLEDHAFERMIGQDPFGSLSAPIQGDFPWYAGGQGPAEAWKRVGLGAPRRWTRPDRPHGPFDPLSQPAEEARVEVFRPDLDLECELLVSDATAPPGAVMRIRESSAAPGRPWQGVTEYIQGSLLLKALDPGVGRYLGLCTLLRHLPDMEDRPQPPSAVAWLAAGLFACAPGVRIGLPNQDAAEERLVERLIELEPSAQRVADLVLERRWTIRAFATAALAAPVPEPPAAPSVGLGDAAWLRPEQGGGPSVAFRQQLRISAPPLATLVALARLEAQGWITRHEVLTLAPGAQPDRRAAPMILGSAHTLTGGRFGVVDESRVPASGAPWTYQLALGDVFGRFGEPSEVQVPLPPRPAIPAPTIRVQLRLAERAAHDQAAVAGSLRVRIPVPALEDLAAGARPLAKVLVRLESAMQETAAPQSGGSVSFDFQLPALLPMEHRRLHVLARFEDDQGGLSMDGVHAIDVADPRSPPIPKTGIGIVWSSRPGPGEEVEIRVRFAGASGARYRVYCSDARGLDIPLKAGTRPRTRAEISVDGAQRGLNGLGMRDRFRLLTDKPLETGADGSVQFDARFPRALETVQFLRFVPLSARGAESAFESCPLLPVAVPSDRQPPAPRVEVRAGATGAAEVTVVAEGLDLISLQAAEPGLFENPPDPEAKAPEFRVRRASGAVPNAIYAREIARGTLERVGNQFRAVLVDYPVADGMIPYVRYHYWAEVRMPPERRLPPDTLEVTLPSGSIQPLQPAQRRDAQSAYSQLSAPAMAILAPASTAGLTPAMVSATTGAAQGGWQVQVSVTGGPRAHPRAVGEYRVQIHVERAPAILSLEGEEPLVDGGLTWSLVVPGAQPAAASVALVLIDPIGRAAAPLFLSTV
jgi:hypothetical protein